MIKIKSQELKSLIDNILNFTDGFDRKGNRVPIPEYYWLDLKMVNNFNKLSADNSLLGIIKKETPQDQINPLNVTWIKFGEDIPDGFKACGTQYTDEPIEVGDEYKKLFKEFFGRRKSFPKFSCETMEEFEAIIKDENK